MHNTERGEERIFWMCERELKDKDSKIMRPWGIFFGPIRVVAEIVFRFLRDLLLCSVNPVPAAMNTAVYSLGLPHP